MNGFPSVPIRFDFVFCIMAECCAKPHLWAQSVVSTKGVNVARKQATKIVRKSGAEVFEVIDVGALLSPVNEVEP